MGIPDGQARKYMRMWDENIFRPMLGYFEALVGDSPVDMDG